MTRGTACKGPIERLARLRAQQQRSRAKRKASGALAAYQRRYRSTRPGLSTPYVRAWRAKKAQNL